MSVSRSIAASFVLGTVVLGGCGSEAVNAGQLESSAVAASATVAHPENPGQKKFLTVMTRNVYLGSDIFVPFQSPDPLGAAAQVWAEIQASNFPARADAIAAEIVAASPDVVGLQEMYRFAVSPLGATEPILQDLDFVALLLARLEARAPGRYRVAASQQQTDLTLPFPSLQVQIRVMDRDVILVDADVDVSTTSGGSFEARLVTSLAGIPVQALRGWVAAEIRKERVETTFVNAHLEVKEFGPIQGLQAVELAQLFAGVRPLVLVADGNSDPRDEAAPLPSPPGGFVPTPYATLTSFLEDAWTTERRGEGFTCCFDADIAPPSRPLFERVDLVLFAADARVMDAYLVGLDPVELAQGLRWPSDHAGVVATLRFDAAR